MKKIQFTHTVSTFRDPLFSLSFIPMCCYQIVPIEPEALWGGVRQTQLEIKCVCCHKLHHMPYRTDESPMFDALNAGLIQITTSRAEYEVVCKECNHAIQENERQGGPIMYGANIKKTDLLDHVEAPKGY